MLSRELQIKLENNLDKQKVTLLLGARRVGKTEILTEIFNKRKDTALWLNGEDTDTYALLEHRSAANYRRMLGDKKLLIIDEAQYIPDISRKVKLMIDSIKPLHIIMTGSSSFDLVQLGEPLVGRSITCQLFPLAQMEWKNKEDLLQTRQNLEDRLIYGSYPELSKLTTNAEKEKYLKELVNTYLLKDIFIFENLRNAQKIKDLLVLIAHQVGNIVSLDELGRQLGMSKNTVERYLDLLSKVFIIYQRGGYSNNLRKEVVKSKKWYFVDNGVHNAILNDFRPIALRNNIGPLWEQYFLGERLKHNTYTDNTPDSYFWRTYDQQEIDLIETKDNAIKAFECKWKESKVKIPGAFSKSYPEAEFNVINQSNYLDWIGG